MDSTLVINGATGYSANTNPEENQTNPTDVDPSLATTKQTPTTFSTASPAQPRAAGTEEDSGQQNRKMTSVKQNVNLQSLPQQPHLPY
jgi:hypothetical protein